LCFRSAFEIMRGHATLFQRLAKLHPQEAAGRIARDAGMETVHQTARRGRILVEQLGQNGEIVVVDYRVDPMPERRELVLYRLYDTANFAAAAYRETLEIDEE
jgi:hypothetical protein